jgi:excisionase family DNA binding protein
VPTDNTTNYDEESDKPLRIKEGAAIIGCDEKTLRDAVDRGEFPHFRVGRIIRLPRRKFMQKVRGDAA